MPRTRPGGWTGVECLEIRMAAIRCLRHMQAGGGFSEFFEGFWFMWLRTYGFKRLRNGENEDDAMRRTKLVSFRVVLPES